MTGRFLVVEGMDGAGKSTHLDFIADQIRSRGVRVVLSREPGGSLLAEQLRELVLHEAMDGLTELLLVFAARRDHLIKTVWPALADGAWVLSDRYLDSSYAYQGLGRGLDLDLIDDLAGRVEAGGRGPDQVFYFDLPAEVAAARRAGRGAGGQVGAAASASANAPVGGGPLVDRFEQEGLGFFRRVREGYRAAAARRGQAAVWIDAQQTVPEIQKLLLEKLLNH